MMESVLHFFMNTFSALFNIPFGNEIFIFIISCMPVLELRGGLLAAFFLHMNPFLSFIICVLGNILPVFFILKWITPLFNRLKKSKYLCKTVQKLEKKATSKKGQIEKYQFWGLLFFVGIPLPGTGVWTGSLIASLINMDLKKAFFACLCGVLLAGFIMSFLSFGILGKIF